MDTSVPDSLTFVSLLLFIGTRVFSLTEHLSRGVKDNK